MIKAIKPVILMLSLGIFFLTLPVTIASAGKNISADQQQMTPEQRRQEMLQQLMKMTPEERLERQERYKNMTEEEQRQQEDRHHKTSEEEHDD